MTVDEFRLSFTAAEPPAGLSLALAGLWWDAKGDWNRAHESAQEYAGRDGAWVHAYLHRKEGDSDCEESGDSAANRVRPHLEPTGGERRVQENCSGCLPASRRMLEFPLRLLQTPARQPRRCSRKARKCSLGFSTPTSSTRVRTKACERRKCRCRDKFAST
jgi:hypothetical protein